MRGLAYFALRGRSQAAMAATVLAMLALLVPLLSILSSAVVALVVLRKGLIDGLVVGAISALASGLLAYLMLGSSLPVVSFMLMLWLPVWILGALLRSTRSLDLVVQLALGFGLLLIGAFYLQLGEPQAQWAEILRPVAEGFKDTQVFDADQSQAFVQVMAAWMNGIFAAAFYSQLLLALLLARNWQSQLFNPGGFQEEFHALRASRVLGIAALPLLGFILFQGADAPGLIRDIGFLVTPLFFFQGLAVVHSVVARAGMHMGWLIAFYMLLVIAMPYAEILVALIGLADVFTDFRGRVKPAAKTGH